MPPPTITTSAFAGNAILPSRPPSPLMALIYQVPARTGMPGDAIAACTVFRSRQAIVIGPTPPGTGVIAPASRVSGALRARAKSRRLGAQPPQQEAHRLLEDVRGHLVGLAPEDPAQADQLAGAHEGPREDLGVAGRDLATVHRGLESVGIAFDDPLVVPAHRRRRDELGLAYHAVEARVLGGEAEERLEAEAFGFGARPPARGRLLHRVAHAAVEILDELVEDPLLAREVEVEGPVRDARGLGDLDDRGLVVAELGEDLLGGLEQPRTGALAAFRAGAAGARGVLGGGSRRLAHRGRPAE